MSHEQTQTMTNNVPLPSKFIDSHHHFLDTRNNSFQSFLGRLVPNECYLPSNYQRDVIDVLATHGVTVLSTVHVECMPDDGALEVAWVDSLPGSLVRAIVGSCHLAADSVDEDLQALVKASPTKVRGVRWILDCVGPFKPHTATHVATTRHDGIDYIGDATFERGFALLETYGLSFDLQCAPLQLPAAARLFSKYPGIPICIDHLGKPRMVTGPDDPTISTVRLNEAELVVWRAGMLAMAALPQVHVKLSMIGYAVPGWIRHSERTEVAKQLCREVVTLFGPQRCMVALNWWKNGACSDADGNSDVGPNPVELLQYMSNWFGDYSQEDRDYLFFKTARGFYLC